MTRLKSDRYAGSKYLEHTPKKKQLFKIPTHEYLQALTGQKFKNYDKICEILTTLPQILETEENKDLAMTEVVRRNDYYYGQFTSTGILHGYGFIIESAGRVRQGVFHDFVLDYGKEHLLIHSDLSYKFTSRCPDLANPVGYFCERNKNGVITEGYKKQWVCNGELYINHDGIKEFGKVASNFSRKY